MNPEEVTPPDNLPLSVAHDFIESLRETGLAFGSSIVGLPRQTALERMSVKEQARLLRKSIQDLQYSDDESDRIVREKINSNFREKELSMYEHDVLDGGHIDHASIIRELANLSTEDFIAFCEWNVARHEFLGKQLARDTPELIEAAIEKTKALIMLDLFPPDARRRMELAGEQFSPLRAMDTFESGVMNAWGYCNDDRISISNQYVFRDGTWKIGSLLDDIFYHELLHGTGIKAGGGFFSGATDRLKGRWVEEAFVAHSTDVVAQGTTNPQFHVLDPMARINDSHVYEAERSLFALMSSSDVADISPELWTQAFFSDPGSKARRAVYEKLSKAFHTFTGNEESFLQFSNQYESAGEREERAALTHKLETKVFQLLGVEVIDESEEPISTGRPFQVTL